MAGGSLLALLDDIASVLDDVSAMTQLAAKKTSGVLGDDLALNAQQVAGVRAARELPVVLMSRPSRDMVREDGLDPDLLGLFVGPTLAEGGEGPDPLPPEILLFLDNLWDYAEGDVDVFREEVRVTYYHELGHYLGLEEGDLEARGIE